MFANQREVAHQIVGAVREFGEALGVHTEEVIRVGANPEIVIIDFARKQAVDLIVLGTAQRSGSDRLFLGPRVERLFNNASCPVVVINVS